MYIYIYICIYIYIYIHIYTIPVFLRPSLGPLLHCRHIVLNFPMSNDSLSLTTILPFTPPFLSPPPPPPPEPRSLETARPRSGCRRHDAPGASSSPPPAHCRAAHRAHTTLICRLLQAHRLLRQSRQASYISSCLYEADFSNKAPSYLCRRQGQQL